MVSKQPTEYKQFFTSETSKHDTWIEKLIIEEGYIKVNKGRLLFRNKNNQLCHVVSYMYNMFDILGIYLEFIKE